MNTDQPRFENGQYSPKRHISCDYSIGIDLSEYESQMLANRLEEMSVLFAQRGDIRVAFETYEWARRVRGSENITVTESEARMLGNRLWEIGECYEANDNRHVAQESKWWARRFHSECKVRENSE